MGHQRRKSWLGARRKAGRGAPVPLCRRSGPEERRGAWIAARPPLALPSPALTPSPCACRLKALGEGSKQWSSSAPNLGKSPKHTPMAPGFASLNEMGKRVGALGVVGRESRDRSPG